MQLPVYLQKTVSVILFLSLLFVAFWIRAQGVHRLPSGQFTENDAYIYRWQAQTIAERGHLPPRDMHRWLPDGRDNGQLLSLYAYAIAYTYKAIGWVSPKLTLYHIQVYAPVVCFILGLGVLIIFLSRVYGVVFAGIVGVILTTLPGTIERSTAGFGDRDAWCWMLGTLVVVSYLWKERLAPGRRRWIATALAGFFVFLGGLSWEGFGFFVLMIVAVELYKFCSTETEHHLKEYILWVFMFVPCLYLISPAYHRGYGFSTHVCALMLLPPLMVFALRGGRYLLLKFVEPLRRHPRKLAGAFTLLVVVCSIGYFYHYEHTFETTAYAFRESPLMKEMTELIDPHFRYWTHRYGGVFVFGSLGVIAASLHHWKWRGVPLAVTQILFTATTFFRWPLSRWIGGSLCDTLFLFSFVLTGVAVAIACNREKKSANVFVTLAMLAWFLLWVGLARGGKRYDFFIGVPLAFFTALLLQFVADTLSRRIRNSQYTTEKFRQDFKHVRLKTGIAVVFILLVLFWPPAGGHIRRSLHAAVAMRPAIPGYHSVFAAFLWIKTRLLKRVENRERVVVAAHWDFGSQLNVLAGVKTINDNDTFRPHWITLYHRHIHQATSEREVLEFLKSHTVTHLMLTPSDPKETFLRGDLSDAFVHIYPAKQDNISDVNLWEIRYPPDIQPNPKYLRTQPEKTDEP